MLKNGNFVLHHQRLLRLFNLPNGKNSRYIDLTLSYDLIILIAKSKLITQRC